VTLDPEIEARFAALEDLIKRAARVNPMGDLLSKIDLPKMLEKGAVAEGQMKLLVDGMAVLNGNLVKIAAKVDTLTAAFHQHVGEIK